MASPSTVDLSLRESSLRDARRRNLIKNLFIRFMERQTMAGEGIEVQYYL